MLAYLEIRISDTFGWPLGVVERALLEDYNRREHSRRVIRALIYHRLTLQFYNHDIMHNILINAHDYIIFISNTMVPILFTTLPGKGQNYNHCIAALLKGRASSGSTLGCICSTDLGSTSFLATCKG